MKTVTKSAIAMCVLTLTACSSTIRTADWKLTDHPTRFRSPNAAASEFNRVVQNGDLNAVSEILGPGATDLVYSGDPVADQNLLAEFAEKMQEGYKLEADSKGDYVILVGPNEWPFPIPLVQSERLWVFDSVKGKEEMLNRRIGENELKTIRVVQAYVDAQEDYFMKDRDQDGAREYAQKIASSPNMKDGLYWKSNDPANQSPLGPFAAQAAAEGYRKASEEPVPYHGYYYKVLTRQGEAADGGKKNYIDKNGQMRSGFALVAYPAKWGTSGIMTFIVNQDGIVFQKDLGIQTLAIAQRMTEFNPDRGWSAVFDSIDEVAEG